MKLSKNILFLIILVLLLTIPLIFYFFPITSEKIQFILKYEKIISIFINQNYFYFILAYSGFVFFSVILNLPGGSIRAILAGYFLGAFIGISTILIITTLSSFLLFLFYKNKIFTKYDLSFLNLNRIFSKIKNEFLFLVTIRLIPVVPFFLQNIIIAKFKISNYKYLLTTLIGIFPTNILYVMIGSEFEDIVNIENINISTILLENKTLIYATSFLVLYLIITNILALISKNKKN